MLTARAVVPTPPLGEKNAMSCPVPGVAGPGATVPARMRSALTRASSSRRANPASITSSAPASRKAMRASTSSGGATMRIGHVFIGPGGQQGAHCSGGGQPFGDDQVDPALAQGDHCLGRGGGLADVLVGARQRSAQRRPQGIIGRADEDYGTVGHGTLSGTGPIRIDSDRVGRYPPTWAILGPASTRRPPSIPSAAPSSCVRRKPRERSVPARAPIRTHAAVPARPGG